MSSNPPSLQAALSILNEALGHTISIIEKVSDNDINTLLRAYKQYSDLMDVLDSIHKVAEQAYRHLSEERLPNVFDGLGFDSVKTGGHNFILSSALYASIPAAKQDEGFKWLKNNGLDALIKPTVNPKALSSAITSYIEENAIEPPDTAMSIHKKRRVGIRKTG